MWRAGLPRVGLRSSPKPGAEVFQEKPLCLYWGCFAAQRGASPLATKEFGHLTCQLPQAEVGSRATGTAGDALEAEHHQPRPNSHCYHQQRV